jgi:DNA-binding CsgD family transcriptional regulator
LIDIFYYESDNLYLSSKKAECAALLTKGQTSKQIAKVMNISHRTVEGYVLDIKNQLQVTLNKTLSKEQLIKILRQSNIQYCVFSTYNNKKITFVQCTRLE